MAAAAVHLSERIFERMSDQRVLFIGAARRPWFVSYEQALEQTDQRGLIASGVVGVFAEVYTG